MAFKNKILAAGLAAIIAGGGIFAANMNTAQAQPAESADVAQLEAQVLQLQQQIAQISALIVQLKSQETCGNGICRFGETATSCPADCNTTTASCAAEGEDVSANKPCCSGLTALNSCTKGSCSYSLPKKCAACGNGICGKNETNQNCPQDCKYEKMTCAQACAQEGYLSAASYCNTWTLLSGQSSALTCAANEFGVGTTQDCNKNRVSGTYSDMACCCNKQSATSIKVSANSLLSNYVYAGDKKVLIYSLNILANGSDMDVQRVTLQFSGAPYKYLSNIYLYNGNTLLTSSPLNNTTVSTVSNFDHEITLSNFSNKFVIPKGTAGRLDIKADVISPLAGVGAIAKMYVITAPNGIRAVDQSNVNYYGSESSETMGSMMIISNKPACGNNVCEAEAGESTINCPADCGQITACAKEGVIVLPYQSCCAGLARIACSGNYCHDNGSGICAKCGNGICGLGEAAANCPADCFGAKTCYSEGEGETGEVGLTAGITIPCCSGLTAQPRTTTSPNGTQAVTEGFVCRKPVVASCKKEGELFGYLEGECCDGLLKVYPDGAKTYSAGESQNFQVTCKKPASYITNAPDKCVAVNIKALANNKYVTVENGGASPLIANRDTAGPWELFYILPAADGSINIKAGFNGKYVTAENGGASPLIANRDTAGPWEKFVLAPIFNTNYVAIMASINNRYVTAENGGAQALVANRDKIGPWEKFTITKVSDCQIQ